jgi:hypothetical protein
MRFCSIQANKYLTLKKGYNFFLHVFPAAEEAAAPPWSSFNPYLPYGQDTSETYVQDMPLCRLFARNALKFWEG